MDETTAPTTSPRTASRQSFYLRRLHSLSGVLPVGVFLVEHLWTNASALGGPQAFDEAVDRIQRVPALPAIEVFGILLPLAFHAVYGFVLMRQASFNAQRYSYGKNWLYVLQRITGVLTLLFVAGHLWEFRVQKWLYGMHHKSFFTVAMAHMSWSKYGVPWIAVGYLVGVAAAVFHLANGLSSFVMSWGIVGSRRAQRAVSWVFGGGGAVLFFLGFSTILYLATGTRLLPGGAPPVETPDCPQGDTPKK